MPSTQYPLPARSWIDTYCMVCMYVDFFWNARARAVALQWRYSGVTVTLHVVTCRYMSLHVITRRYMALHVVTCRYTALHNVI